MKIENLFRIPTLAKLKGVKRQAMHELISRLLKEKQITPIIVDQVPHYDIDQLPDIAKVRVREKTITK